MRKSQAQRKLQFRQRYSNKLTVSVNRKGVVDVDVVKGNMKNIKGAFPPVGRL